MQKITGTNGNGSFKPKKCKVCKDIFTPSRPLQSVCSPVCAYRKVCEDKKNDWKKKKSVLKEKLKTVGDYKKEARVVFQKWIRERDKHSPCISCGAKTAVQWHAGHYLNAELYSGLIFDERNVHKQCSRCNDLLGGNELNYRDGLILRYGEEYVTMLEQIKNEARKYKYSKEDLIEIKKKYTQLLK